MTFKTKVQVGLIIILATVALSLILSQNSNPNMPPFFALKRIQEKAFLSFKNDPKDKLEYLRRLLNNRLEELANIVKNENYTHVLKASLRYSTTAGQITDLILANGMDEYLDSTKQQFLDHQKVLNEVYVIYPKNTDNLEYKYIEDDINYLKIYLDKLASS